MSTTATKASLSAPVKQLLELLARRPEILNLKSSIAERENLVVEGVIRPARGPIWSCLRGFEGKPEPGPSLWVTPTSDGAEVLVEDLRALGYCKLGGQFVTKTLKKLPSSMFMDISRFSM